jgi:uncharacterized protein (TIGR02466 family)
MTNIKNIFSAGISIHILNEINNKDIIKYAEKNNNFKIKKDIKNILKNKVFEKLNNIVKNKMQDYFSNIYSKKYNIKLDSGWTNVDNEEFISIPHVHTEGFLSAVYYPLSTDGKLVFLNPMVALLSKQSSNIIENYNEFNSEYFQIDVKTNYLVIFNSMLQHHIMYSKQKRISVAYNGII